MLWTKRFKAYVSINRFGRLTELLNAKPNTLRSWLIVVVIVQKGTMNEIRRLCQVKKCERCRECNLKIPF